MKINHNLSLLLVCLLATMSICAQNKPGIDSTGLPGDNFSLQAALALFQKAVSPEDFERQLNSEDSHVNNLDLNNDGEIDYIRIIDKSEKNAHAFILQAVISEKESQDVAVIELERTGDSTAVVQIVGDEDLYGEQVIVEPGEGEGADDEEAYLPNETELKTVRGPQPNFVTHHPRIVVNVWFWPSVRFVYAPAYRPWVSIWRWRHYPGWWRPWRPRVWSVWHPLHRPYHAHFGIAVTHRVLHAHRIYRPHRVTSVTVRTRHASVVGNYRVTKTRTSVSGPRGHGATRTKTKVTGPRGNSRTKTTIKRR